VNYVCVDRVDPAGHPVRVEFRDERETYVVFLADQRAATISKEEYGRWLMSDEDALVIKSNDGSAIVWLKEGPEIWVRSLMPLADFKAVQLALGVRLL
jgi:hypothetical protein